MVLQIKVKRLTEYQIKQHEQHVLKELIAISDQPKLLLGPLDKFPEETVPVPDYAKILPDVNVSNINHNEKKDILEYPMMMKDPLGEKKIDNNGLLLNSRKYLFNTFKFEEYYHKTTFVLLDDLLQILKYDKSKSKFKLEFPQLLLLTPTDEELRLIRENLPIISNDIGGNNLRNYEFLTARSAFIQFGASVILCGSRLIDDYWEQAATAANLTNHHRVFKISKKMINLLSTLRPIRSKKNSLTLKKSKSDSLENPYSSIVEQASEQVRKEYQEAFTRGEPFSTVVPGQSITGSLEITSQFRIPKYHNKNSFQQAHSARAMNKPIGLPDQRLPSTQQPDTSLNENEHEGTAETQLSTISTAMNESQMDQMSTASAFDQMGKEGSSNSLSIPTPIQAKAMKNILSGNNSFKDIVLDTSNTDTHNYESYNNDTSNPDTNIPINNNNNTHTSNINNDDDDDENDDSNVNTATVTPSHMVENNDPNVTNSSVVSQFPSQSIGLLSSATTPLNPLGTITLVSHTNQFSLNINGWKFDTLPLQSPEIKRSSYSSKGLPFYNRNTIAHRLKKLTPHQIKEVEHLHDSVMLNTGLQLARDVRNNRWIKYWQFKSGVPVGLLQSQVEEFKRDYFSEMLKQTKSETVYNPLTNTDEITKTTRIPNANFLNYSNINGKRPPYVSKPTNFRK
ncbi:hypothetical protein TBLA_0C00290 [Henningerozyma blattae CBS 6284]|uniref:Uncharacterized protein n=1 Tax=Henningerozyma blattae (strain ATCC 34711 / CBS 6284 / DSM 70876 / NBRC 10599 / NRRL Y-10934 / UCD 77-7) TaxID=1071380 RepID=I2H0E4_HENB6|nr:hypothetical protein TBLA_0C00290 [Tetrapisispora blattae CBS 6284]CCH59846.1 hypothetical protein TBLA_0C00290 [Tetrapisispora blattae CBS 6284]